MEKNTTNYKFLNAKDRASERKNSHGILDTDRYHYKTAPHGQNGKPEAPADRQRKVRDAVLDAEAGIHRG